MVPFDDDDDLMVVGVFDDVRQGGARATSRGSVAGSCGRLEVRASKYRKAAW